MADVKTYSYVAISATGDRKKGKMDAESPTTVSSTLQAEGLIPLEVTEFKKSLSTINITKPKEEKELKLKPADRVIFARQLYLLVRAGLALSRSLVIMGDDHDDVRFTRMCNDLSEKVLSGMMLSKAMEAYPKAFDEVFTAYIAAGESTGNMEEALYRLARMLEKGHQLRLKVKAVTAYPKMVSIAIFGVVVVIMMFLVPSFAKIYEGFGAQLPAPTRLMVAISGIMAPIRMKFGGGFPFVGLQDRHIWETPLNFYSPMFWLLAGFFGFKYWKRKNEENLELMMKLDKLKFRFPVMGKLWKFNMLYRWSSTMAGALQSGLQTYVALDLAGRTAGSPWVRYVSIELMEAVRSGRPLSSELVKHPDLFSAQLRAMAATGEEAGEAAEMFDNVARTLEDEIEAMVAVLGARLEVVLLLIMGVVVGTMVIVLYLPIFGLSTTAMNGFENGANPGG